MGRIVQADVFFNTRHDWAVYTGCDPMSGPSDVVNIGVHEFALTVALRHVNNEFATTAPTASRGEVRKITPTTGDEDGFDALLAGPPRLLTITARPCATGILATASASNPNL